MEKIGNFEVVIIAGEGRIAIKEKPHRVFVYKPGEAFFDKNSQIIIAPGHIICGGCGEYIIAAVYLKANKEYLNRLCLEKNSKFKNRYVIWNPNELASLRLIKVARINMSLYLYAEAIVNNSGYETLYDLENQKDPICFRCHARLNG